MKWGICAGIVAAVLPVLSAAEPLSDAPILRIETGRHTAFIHALVLDETSGRAYTASEDRTIRVWRIIDGRALDTFRVPAGMRADGQLYALALSPDHRILAAAGWTCWDTEGRACVYLIDAASGALLSRITGLEEVVATLRFTPDGAHLAVGLMGSQGLRVFRVADRVLVAADRAYRDKLLELDVDSRGRFLASGLDGFVRLYDEHFALVGRVNADLAGHQPFGLRYSPDGRLIAIGFNDVARINVLRARDFKVIATLAPGANAPLRNLTRVAWAPDSSAVYGAGEPSDSARPPIFRWRLANISRVERMEAARGRVGDIALTRDQRILFVSEDPALGMIDPSGKRRYLLTSGIPDFQSAAQNFRISKDGSQIEIALGPTAGALRDFSVQRQTLEHPGAPAAGLAVPRLKAPGWRIDHWNASESPQINGKRVSLEPYETARAFTITAASDLMLLGTEWALRAVDKSGKQRWSVRTSAVVRAVNTSGDGRFAVAALADGTIDWYSMKDGTALLSLFLHADGETWVAWAPRGEYVSSAYGDTYVGWQFNRGKDRPPDFFRAVQFEREMYRPDLIANRLRSVDSVVAAAPADLETASLAAIAPPRLSIEVPALWAASTPGGVRPIRVIAESTGLPMREVSLYVNDIPITPTRERALKTSQTSRFTQEFYVPTVPTDSEIRVEVFNGRSIGVVEKLVPAAAVSAPPNPPGDLYVLAVGANIFPGLGNDVSLSFAARDADEIANAFKTLGARQFRHVFVQTLTDSGRPPVRAAVLDGLQALTRARGSDTLVVFLASHGISDAAGNYYFVPRDARQVDVDTVLDGRSLPASASLIGSQWFFDTLRNVPGRRLLIVDTCQARNISGRYQDFTLVKRSASSHIAFMLASKGDEESQELAIASHGLFTYGLLEGLHGSADFDHDGRTTLTEWFGFAASTVDRLRDRRIGSQTPQLIAPPVLRSMAFIQATR